jgi:hypothetical protein
MPPDDGSVSQKTRNSEMAIISRSLSDRLRRVCSHMSESDFAAMVQKMADVQWRSEHPRVDAFAADLLGHPRDDESR